MQTSLSFIALLGCVALAAACGGRIESVPDPTPADPGAADVPSASEPPADTPEPSPPGPSLQAGCTSFGQVLAELDRLGCSTSACHGEANLPLIDPRRALETKRGFYAFVLSNGMRYVDFRSLDPSSSAITCNLRGACGVPMPLGAKAPASSLDLIDDWLACGAPP